MKKFTGERVAPTIAANVSCGIFGSARSGSLWSRLASRSRARASRFSLQVKS
jgi:hypothetical protein